MNRSDFIKLSRLRLRDAKVLLTSGNCEGAYYLCGYAVECALKACIAKRTRRHDFPDLKTVKDSYTHKLPDLVKVGGLERDLEQRIQGDPKFEVNWALVKDWSEESRYQQRSHVEAHELYSAVASRKHGVLGWIKEHW